MLKSAIQILAENYDKPLDDYLQYKQIIEENKDDPELYNYIKDNFRPMNLKLGTNGAYLWGCDQKYYGNVNQACSALCNGGISHEYTQTCQYQIWTYKQQLTLRDNVSSSKAYIYVESDWTEFKKKDLEILKENGVKFATILNTNNSKHDIILPITEVDKLPIREESIYIQTTSYTKYYILFFIILIFLLIFIINY
jgi:hypothetical protein